MPSVAGVAQARATRLRTDGSGASRAEAERNQGVGSLLHEIEADPSHPLNPASLRAELAADLFAVSVLLQATVDIKPRAATGDLDPARFAVEAFAVCNTIALIERCHLAVAAAGTTMPEALGRRYAVQPVATMCRMDVIRWYLANAFTAFYAGDGDPDDQARQARWLKVQTRRRGSSSQRSARSNAGSLRRCAPS